MFRDLRVRVSAKRRALAWVILAALIATCAFAFHRLSANPIVHQTASAVLWIALAFILARAVTFLLIDPLAQQRKNATPGFARDMIVVALYLLIIGWLLRAVAGVSLGPLLGTGALVAAVIGLSMQETLGNIFAGLSLSLDGAFEVGDWIEIASSGKPRVGRVEAMTWRAVQLVSWDGDTDMIPNRVMAQSVITNLYAPAGFHRRTARYTIAASARLHEILDLLAIAMAGLPHEAGKQPKAAVKEQDQGGVMIECQWWALGYRHSKASFNDIYRIVPTVLAREGVPLMGPDGPSAVDIPPTEPSELQLAEVVRLLKLPAHWVERLQGKVRLRHKAPGEGVIRQGDAGDSLYAVLEGSLAVVHSERRETPYHGLFWNIAAELGPGEWLGEMSLLTGAARSANIIAIKPSLLLEMDKAAFESSLRGEPEVMEQLLDLMEHRAASKQGAAETIASGFREQWARQIREWFSLN